MVDLPECPQAAQAREPADAAPTAGEGEGEAGGAPAQPGGAISSEPDPLAAFLHMATQVRDRAKLAIRQHDLPTLGQAVHDLADLVHRMIRGPGSGA